MCREDCLGPTSQPVTPGLFLLALPDQPEGIGFASQNMYMASPERLGLLVKRYTTAPGRCQVKDSDSTRQQGNEEAWQQ